MANCNFKYILIAWRLIIMAFKMTKRGQADNETTNEFICETIADRDAIPAS